MNFLSFAFESILGLFLVALFLCLFAVIVIVVRFIYRDLKGLPHYSILSEKMQHNIRYGLAVLIVLLMALATAYLGQEP